MAALISTCTAFSQRNQFTNDITQMTQINASCGVPASLVLIAPTHGGMARLCWANSFW